MGLAPSFWAIDSYDRPTEDAPPQIDALEQLWPVLDALQLQPERRNVRIKRLVEMLARRFPVLDTSGEGESVWEDGIVPNAEFCGMSSFFAAPLDARHSHAVLPDAVTWARELFLDIFDDEFGVYVPFRGRPVPLERGIQYMQAFFRKNARLPWSNRLSLRESLIEQFTLLLSPSGFVFSPDDSLDARFVRQVDDGLQTISAVIFGEEKSLRCRVFISQTSQAVASLLAGLTPSDPTGASTGGVLSAAGRTVLADQLDILRGQRDAGWLDERTGWPWATYIGTQFWLDWMLEDLAQWVVPMLDQASSMAGLVQVLDGEAHQWLHRNARSAAFVEEGPDVHLNLMALLQITGNPARARDLKHHLGQSANGELRLDSHDGKTLCRLLDTA